MGHKYETEVPVLSQKMCATYISSYKKHGFESYLIQKEILFHLPEECDALSVWDKEALSSIYYPCYLLNV